jgi:hypothetical protein
VSEDEDVQAGTLDLKRWELALREREVVAREQLARRTWWDRHGVVLAGLGTGIVAALATYVATLQSVSFNREQLEAQMALDRQQFDRQMEFERIRFERDLQMEAERGATEARRTAGILFGQALQTEDEFRMISNMCFLAKNDLLGPMSDQVRQIIETIKDQSGKTYLCPDL